ncbi:hypothetical protein M427DRAFT_482572 [Gonapodya prolifera JEL478]|uniref:Protein kinase domain-containing protein n=1 Tax=Gonapodya prolifera (strain JEL478) TaxID=1344416 RepID=A0A139A0R7_GONPJ|nr:hypothetical protein M427DRAFT_482572 [Gonapodya prolifera JEL478]|eukprot:KXS10369.1 hypothetical protein M427DRAFT_482572 [Gonapodya prolifera JEL478]
MTCTKLKRPDFGYLLRHNCVLRGEEKPPISGDDPRRELVDKLVWTYDPAPYVFGYYTFGAMLTIVAIVDPQGSLEKPTVCDVVTSNLKLRRERVRHLRRIFNLCRLIVPLEQILPNRGAPELKPVERDDKIVELGDNAVKKTFKIDAAEKIQHLQSVYQSLRTLKVPNTDTLLGCSADSVWLSPKGLDILPGDEGELVDALVCILEALEKMHEGHPPIYHRDIRWPNVICRRKRLSSSSSWYLIDWDEAAWQPTVAAQHLNRLCHAPEVFLDGHGAEVDIWGVGQLIFECGQRGVRLSDDIQHLGLRMKGSVESRPTASEALEMLLRLFTVERCTRPYQ